MATGPDSPHTPEPPYDPNAPHVYDVPGGGRVISWQEPNPNFQPEFSADPKFNPQYVSKTQYVPASSGSQYFHTTERLIDPNQIAVERLRAQNQMDIANLQHQIATEKNDLERQQLQQQLGLKQQEMAQLARYQGGELTGMYNGEPTLAARRQGFEQFKYLSELAANPRNFMESFFARRGYAPPPNYQQYGAGFIPSFAQPAQQPAARAPQSVVPQFAQTPSALATQGRAALGPGISVGIGNVQGYDQGGRAYGTPPAQIGGGTPIGPAGEPAAYQPFREAVGRDVAGGTVSAEQAQRAVLGPGGQPIYMAAGGVVPEPVAGIGLRSGQRYMFGERGPEGVVPAGMLPKFLQDHGGNLAGPGAAVGSQAQEDTRGYESGGMVGYPSGDFTNTYAVGGVIGTDEPGIPPQPDPLLQQQGLGNYLSTLPPLAPIYPTTTPAPSSSPTDMFAAPAYTPPFQFPTAPSTTTPTPAPTSPAPAAVPTSPAPTTTATPPPPPPPAPPPPVPTVPAPVPAVPRVFTPSANPVPTPPPAALLPPMPPAAPHYTDFAPSFSAYGRANPAFNPGEANPITSQTLQNFLPTFLPGEDTPLGKLAASDAIPPFLARLFAQGRGIGSQGTNRPQAFNLPPEVPLVSRLAYLQMAPTERQALESYISSYGISPTDYFDYVDQVSPQGPRAREPLFGSNLGFLRQ